jgi:hypothetical protein
MMLDLGLIENGQISGQAGERRMQIRFTSLPKIILKKLIYAKRETEEGFSDSN